MRVPFGLLCGHDSLGTRVQPAGRNTSIQERAIITSPIEFSRGALDLCLDKVLLERLFNVVASWRPTNVEDAAVAVIDEVPAIRRSNHVEVEIKGNFLFLLFRQVGNVVLRADQTIFFGCPPAEADGISNTELRELKGDFEETNRSRPIVVDTLIIIVYL